MNDDEQVVLDNISKAVTKFKKENTFRPRIMVVTNSDRPVTVAIGPYDG